MPRTRTIHPTARPSAPRSHHRRPRTSGHTPVEVRGPRRCPDCLHPLAHLPPLTDSVIEAAEVVARRYVDGDLTTSTHLAALRGVTLHQAGKILKVAAEKGLLARESTPLRGGGLTFIYRPLPTVATYVASEGLARQLLLALATR